MNTPEQLAALQEKSGVFFNDFDLLQQVFVHRSYLNEHRGSVKEHNERLEFLGDAVLELVVTEHLYRNYANPEGELTNWRSALVKGVTLAEVARELDFSEYLLLSRGEARSGGKDKGLLLANAFEAFVGALYLDQGYEASKSFIERFLLVLLPTILEKQLFIDPKSRLQEYTQAAFGVTPAYVLVDASGPDHAKQFVMGVEVDGKQVAQGSGSSKQIAQTEAALAAIEAYGAETVSQQGL